MVKIARRLIVEIYGDASALEASMAKASGAAEGFGSKLAGVAKVAGIALGGAAVGGLAIVLDKSVKAAMAAQQETARLDQVLKNAGISAKDSASAFNTAEAASRRLGFTNEDVRNSLGSLITATGSVKTSMSDLGVAEDIARFKNVGLSDASKMLTTAMAGSQRAAHQLGIIVSPVTTNLDALKATSMDLTTATGHLAEAHAKLLDKLATGNAVIQAVADKTKGMADAFSGTLPGQIEMAKAQLQNLEEELGAKLLPVITSAISYVTAHWPEISAAMKQVWSQIEPVLLALKTDIADVITVMREHWSTVMLIIGPFVDQIKTGLAVVMGALKLVADLLEGHWSAAWHQALAIVVTVLDGVWKQVTDHVAQIGAAAKAIGDALWNGIKWGADKIAGAVTGALKALNNAITNAENWVYDEAVKIGEAIINGVAHGLGGIASSIGKTLSSGLHGAINAAKGFLGIGSPSRMTWEQIGVPLAQGIIGGYAEGIKPFPQFMSDNLSSMLAAADAQLRAGMAKMGKEIGVAGPSTLGDASSLASMASGQAATASALAQYQTDYYDTSFASPGYSVGMSAAQVYGLSNQPPAVTITVDSQGDALSRAIANSLVVQSNQNGGTLKTVMGGP